MESTAIFLHPPKTLRHFDVLLTNFHLPQSTLLMLVCAMAGREGVPAAYHEAVGERYRFFSYGDCLLIL
jgi:S-adenosylmethionine:tRNA ribosyltransferase-isomerase